MRKADAQMLEDRAARNAARKAFDTRLAQVRQDVEARGVGGRIADRASTEAIEILEEAVSVANENRAIVAGTIGALAVWILRNPIIAWVDSLLDLDLELEDENHE